MLEKRSNGIMVMAVFVVASAPSTQAQTVSFTGIESPPASVTRTSRAEHVSADGTTVVGSTSEGNRAFVGYYWTEGGGLTVIEPSAGFVLGDAFGVSSDGSEIVGNQFDFVLDADPYRWNTFQGVQPISIVGVFAGLSVTSIADNGNFLAGAGINTSNPVFQEAFRWSQFGGFTKLGDLNNQGVLLSSANDLSADGTVVVGTGRNNDGFSEAFRWTQFPGMVGLGTIDDGCCGSEGLGVSPDGTIVVGASDLIAEGEVLPNDTAFMWTDATGMVNLGTVPEGFASRANAVNADGTVVVGTSETARGPVAAFWRPDIGMVNIEQILRLGGADLRGWALTTATSVSDEGTVIVGVGLHDGSTEGWVAVIPLPPPLITSQPDNLSVTEGDMASFSISVESTTATPSFQWRQDGVDLINGSNFSGVNTTTLSIASAALANAGVYDCIVSTDLLDRVSDPASLSVCMGEDVPPTPPTITDQPDNLSIEVGENAIFSISATGPFTPTYQWRRDGADLNNGGDVSGASSSQLTISSAEIDDFGVYDCVVTSGAAFTISTGAALCVVEPAPLDCRGDANNDGFVEFADITAVLNNWLVVCPGN